MFIACGEESPFLTGRQFVGCPVTTGGFQEGQRTIIHDHVICEKLLRGLESVGKQAPQTPAADFRSGAFEPGDWSPRMLISWLIDQRKNSQPLAHESHFSKWDASLYHSKRSWVHAQK